MGFKLVITCAFRWIPISIGILVPLIAIAEEPQPNESCSTDLAMISADYPTANMGVCEAIDEASFMLRLLPEDVPINPSPWYGFKVTRFPSYQERTLKVALFYGDFEHRYSPKVSFDGATWSLLPLDNVATIATNHIELTIPVNQNQIYISAQESFGNARHDEWLDSQLHRWPAAQIQILGHSHGKQPISAFVANRSAPKIILLLGRAHPPEVPGAIAFQYFVDRLFSRRIQDCAKRLPTCQFFLDHQFVLVPNLNPDGVTQGYWRHNLDSTDLNRDWGVFNQPETTAVHHFLLEELKSGDSLALMLDFHSTRRNVLYTQTEDDITVPPQFAQKWFAARELFGIEPFMEYAPREYNPELGTSKNYFFNLGGIPAITFEIGDNTTRDEIAAISTQFADALISVINTESTSPSQVYYEDRDFFYLMSLANSASLVALTEQGYIATDESIDIQEAQKEILEEIATGTRETSSNYLDLEEALIAKAGSSASNVHLGRSRQDLHGITRRMLARESLLETMSVLGDVLQKLNQRSEREANTAIPMFTHGVPAHPTTLGHQLQAFVSVFSRDFARLQDAYGRLNFSQLGAMAAIGSSLPLNRKRMAELLAFSGPVPNTFDANFLSTSDYKLEIAFALSNSAHNVTMFVENVHSPLRDPNPWIFLNEEGTSISSSMPQKQNPRPLDRLRTAANDVIGTATVQSLRSHNVDTGMHDYRSVNLLLEQMDQARKMYEQLIELVDLIEIDEKRTEEIIQASHILSSSLVEVIHREKSISLRDAHVYVRALITIARTEQVSLRDLSNDVFATTYKQTFGERAPESLITELKHHLEIDVYLRSRTTEGGPGSNNLVSQIESNKENVLSNVEWINIQKASVYEIENQLHNIFQQMKEN